jgi:Cu2+-exporting ATPase
MPNGQACYHCGQPAPAQGRWSTRIDGQDRAMCCAGCQAVAQAIVDAGLHDYYRHRAHPAAGPSAVPPELDELKLYDEPELAARYVRDDPSAHCQEATLLLDGLRCGACVWLIERTLAAAPGVTGASVNFATERAVVRWDPARARLSDILTRIAAIGYRALPYDARRREAQLALGTRQLVRRLFVAGIGMMQVMMYAVPAYTAGAGGIEPEFEQLMRWASLVLTIPAMLYSAQPFFAGALRDLRARSPGMDVPVALGLSAAFAASTWSTVVGHGEVYFDSVTMFIFLLLSARYLEWIARRRASRAVDAMAAALPEQVTRLLDPPSGLTEAALAAAVLEQIPAARAAPGDLLKVVVGERFAVDATIVAGATSVDQSLLTGESEPVPRRVGDEVAGGSVNAGSPVWVQVRRAAADSTLSTIERLIERAALDKPAIALAADRAAGWFVLALLAVAATVAAIWWTIDPARVLPVAVSVLVVSCPCALSLATPAALAAATGAITRRGILVASGRALETIATCTDVVLDKTGTLTAGRPRLVATQGFSGCDTGDALRLAAALGAGSAHPLAAALIDAAALVDPGEPSQADAHARTPAASALVQHPGLGVEGTVDGQRYRLGSAAFVAGWTAVPLTGAGPGSEVWLADPTGPLARFELRDTLRADARATVDALRAQGLRPHLLSGDRASAVETVATELGIDTWQAQSTPSGKLDYVRALQRDGRRVLMVGDGINDAPVLAAADASLAVGEATALARTAADTVLLSPSLEMVPAMVELARRTRRVILQNLAWAGLYNAVAIPAAAVGWVPPWLAAIGMSASSLLVVGNALRLRLHRGASHTIAARAPRATAATPSARI